MLTVVHPWATVAPSAALGGGTVIMAGAVVNPDARIGDGVIINTGAVAEHDVVVGAYAHLGLGGVLLPGIRVGASAIIGAGAVVTRDISDHVIAVGVPARSSARFEISPDDAAAMREQRAGFLSTPRPASRLATVRDSKARAKEGLLARGGCNP